MYKPPTVLWALVLLAVVQGCAATGAERTVHAPYEMVLPRAGGGTVTFSDFRGSVLLVDLFTTWNQISMLTIPGYINLYQRYRARGLTAVGVALDELGEVVVAPYAQGLAIPYPVALADERVVGGRTAFGDLSVLPALMLFDREGMLRRVFFGRVPQAAVEKAIQDLLR